MSPVGVILKLCASLLGNDDQGAGLLVKREGYWHTRGCSFGQYRTEGDSQRGGADCSDRCVQVNAAIDAAEDWLKLADERPVQAALGLGQEVAG